MSTNKSGAALQTLIDSAKERLRTTPRFEGVNLNPPVGFVERVLLNSILADDLLVDILPLFEIHDGEAGPLGFLSIGAYFLSARDVCHHYRQELDFGGNDEPDREISCNGPVRNFVSSRRWIPLIGWYDVTLYLDYTPDQGGREGQIILVDKINKSNAVAFFSIEDLLRKFSDALESGKDELSIS